MEKHQSLLVIFLILAGLIASIFLHIYRSSLITYGAEGMYNPTRKRYFFFLILASVAVILMSVTIPDSPYFMFADKQPSKVVFVAAKQFSFILSNQAIDPKKAGAGENIEIPVGELVEFRVSSLDVTHGFAIYDDKSNLVAQTQAMPGYINKLRWKFNTPGTYNILCLEFCGVAHAFMRASIVVK